MFHGVWNCRCYSILLLSCLLAFSAHAETDNLRERMEFAKQVDAELINNPVHAAHWLTSPH